MRLLGLALAVFLLGLSAFAQSEREKVSSLVATLPKMTKARIKRGTRVIPVDLSQLTAKSLIKDYDVLELEDGVYSTLGNFTAKYVRVKGHGPRKTIISSITMDSKPILVNSTELWDLTVADAKFKLVDQSGLWAVNVEFVGPVVVSPAALDKSPSFSVRTALSDLSEAELSTEDAHFLSRQGDRILLPLPSSLSRENLTLKALLDYEDQFDRSKDLHLKKRIGYKGLFARSMNYLYQKGVLKPSYDHQRFEQLTRQARAAKAKGHLYVAMLDWAEADRLSGHSRFDEVLREITPLTQNVGRECGCTVEGQGLAANLKSEIENKLYTKFPVTGLPGNCKIQLLHVNIPEGGKKDTLIAEARMKAMSPEAPNDDEFAVGAEAPAPAKDFTEVADVEIAGKKKSYTSDKGESTQEEIVDPISQSISEVLASKVKAAAAKMASSDLIAKVDGFIIRTLFGDDEARQDEYEKLHEQQFGRKMSSTGAMSSVFAY